MVYAGAGVLICRECRETKRAAVRALQASVERVDHHPVTETRYGVLAYMPDSDPPLTMLAWIKDRLPVTMMQQTERPTRGR